MKWLPCMVTCPHRWSPVAWGKRSIGSPTPPPGHLSPIPSHAAIAGRKVFGAAAHTHSSKACNDQHLTRLLCAAQASQQPLSQLQKDSPPLAAHRDAVSGLLYSPQPLDCIAAEVAAAQASAVSSCPTVFLGSFRMPLDPELTEHEDVEAVFGFMEQHPDGSRFETPARPNTRLMWTLLCWHWQFAYVNRFGGDDSGAAREKRATSS
jgi:hypothetical protein